jgi:hypothetical protein
MQYEHHVVNYLYVMPVVRNGVGGLIVPNDHEKSEWARMGESALDAGYDGVARRYLSAGTHPNGQPMLIERFDALQCAYRSWLCFNDFKAADYMVHGAEHRAHHTGNFT